MWVFGYGSLMWDGWETNFGCLASERAELSEFIRSFNKASERNWGSRETPGPTLGLVSCAGYSCVGRAFDFPDTRTDYARSEFTKREGSSFTLSFRDIRLAGGRTVPALVAINEISNRTHIGDQSLPERVELARRACGSSGKCRDYIDRLRAKLVELDIKDTAVEEFWRLLHEVA